MKNQAKSICGAQEMTLSLSELQRLLTSNNNVSLSLSITFIINGSVSQLFVGQEPLNHDAQDETER